MDGRDLSVAYGVQMLWMLLLFSFTSVRFATAQGGARLGLLNIESLHGSLVIEKELQFREDTRNSVMVERSDGSALTGQVLLDSRSFIWHPDFIQFDTAVEYSPSTQQTQLLSAPDRGEVRNAKKLRLMVSLLRKLPWSTQLFTNVDHQFANREFLSNVETRSTDIGGTTNYRNSFLPLRISYIHSRLDQNELQSGRRLANRSPQLRIETTKSLTAADESRLSLDWEDRSADYTDRASSSSRVMSLNFRNSLSLDRDKGDEIATVVRYSRRTGISSLERLQVQEQLRRSLRGGFKLSGGYQHSRTIEADASRLSGWNITLSHRLYKSLETRYSLERSQLRQTDYAEGQRTSRLNFEYQKYVPYGHLTLNYERYGGAEDRQNAVGAVLNRNVDLQDGEELLLDHPDVVRESIVVTDPAGTITYTELLDYDLVSRGALLELRRVPGGRIANGATVHVAYTLAGQGAYQYGTEGRHMGVNLSFFGNLFEVFYRSASNDFKNVEGAEQRILKVGGRRSWGGGVNLGLLDAGIEMEDDDNNQLPSRARRLHVSLSPPILLNRLGISVRSSYGERELVREREDQRTFSVFGRLGMRIGLRSNLKLTGAYRSQQAPGISFRETTARGDWAIYYRALQLTLGAEAFRKQLLGEQQDFARGYVRLERVF